MSKLCTKICDVLFGELREYLLKVVAAVNTASPLRWFVSLVGTLTQYKTLT